MRKVETDLNSSVALLRWSAGIEDSYSPKKRNVIFLKTMSRLTC